MYDRNTDGKLDATEKAALVQMFNLEPKGRLSVYDKNHDGKLSDDEIKAIPATETISLNR